MCLAIPGKVVQWDEREPPFARAVVEFGGVRRRVSMDFVPDAEVDDYVMVHAGVAISQVDAQEALRSLELLAEIDIMEELGPDAPGPADEAKPSESELPLAQNTNDGQTPSRGLDKEPQMNSD